MGIIITNADFIGEYKVAQDSYTTSDIDAVIASNEKKLLVDLLGLELFDLFEADLVDRVPQTAIYLTIYNELFYTSQSCEFHSKGMKAYLLGQLYLLYLRNNGIKNTTGGAVKQQYETSEQLDGQGYLPVIKYNDSIDAGNIIQHYIRINDTDYPTFNGQGLQYLSMI